MTSLFDRKQLSICSFGWEHVIESTALFVLSCQESKLIYGSPEDWYEHSFSQHRDFRYGQ